MSVSSEGIIQAPVSISDVQKAVSNSSTDLGTLCKSSSINMWAKYKPISYSTLGTLTEAQRAAANYGLRRNKDGSSYYAKPSSASVGGYTYVKPSGGSTSPYRLGDFTNEGKSGYNGYNPNAKAPCTGHWMMVGDSSADPTTWRTTQSSALQMSLVWNNADSTSITASDLKNDPGESGTTVADITTMYFCIAVLFNGGVSTPLYKTCASTIGDGSSVSLITYSLTEIINQMGSSVYVANMMNGATQATIYFCACNNQSTSYTAESAVPSGTYFFPLPISNGSVTIAVDQTYGVAVSGLGYHYYPTWSNQSLMSTATYNPATSFASFTNNRGLFFAATVKNTSSSSVTFDITNCYISATITEWNGSKSYSISSMAFRPKTLTVSNSTYTDGSEITATSYTLAANGSVTWKLGLANFLANASTSGLPAGSYQVVANIYFGSTKVMTDTVFISVTA